jgi:hypothetical protein
MSRLNDYQNLEVGLQNLGIFDGSGGGPTILRIFVYTNNQISSSTVLLALDAG